EVAVAASLRDACARPAGPRLQVRVSWYLETAQKMIDCLSYGFGAAHKAATTAQRAPTLRAIAPRQRRAAMLRARCEENYQVDRSRPLVDCRGSPPEPASFHRPEGRARRLRSFGQNRPA